MFDFTIYNLAHLVLFHIIYLLESHLWLQDFKVSDLFLLICLKLYVLLRTLNRIGNRETKTNKIKCFHIWISIHSKQSKKETMSSNLKSYIVHLYVFYS